nr:hypothetical protein [Tanacetum cinerariifolium]
MQTQTSNTLHNAIMEAGGKDRPLMLAPDKTVPVSDGSSEKTTETYMENYKNVSQDIRDQMNTEAEAVQIILTGIDNDIYSTVNACPNACEMWKAIERSQQAATRNRGKAIVNSPPPIYDQEPAMSKLIGGMTLMIKSEDRELEAHYMYMAQIQEVTPDDADDSGPIFDTEPMQKIPNNDNYNVFAIENMSYDREQVDQNDDDDDLANERELLASLIEKLKCEIDDSKNSNKFLETSSKVLVEKLKGEIKDFKNKNKSLESSKNRFKEANNKLSETNKLMYTDLKKFQAELDERNDVKYASKVKIDCAKAKGDLISYKMEYKELDKVIALENKVKILDNIVYKTGQSVQIMNMLNSKCRTSFAKPEFLKKAQRENPRMYDIGCYNDNLALMLAPESDEEIRLEKESRSKLSDLIRPFDYDKLNNLYDLFVPQCEKSSEQRYFSERSKMSHTPVNNGNSKESFNKQTTLLEKRMDESIPWDQKCKRSKELFKIKRSVGMIFDGVERCKETIAKQTYFGHIDPFIQNTIEENFCPEIQRISADLEKFHLCLKEEMVADLRYFNSLELEVTNLQCNYLKMLEKCKCLEKELSKSKMMSKSFEALQKHEINLEIDLQQCQEKIKNDKSFKENQSKEFRKEREQYFEIQDLKAQLQDKGIAISELKKLLEKLKGKSVDTKFEKSSVIRQPNAFKIQRPSILGYNWKPKSEIGNVNSNVSMPQGNASRTANILEHMTPRHSTVSNTTLYSNSFAARRDYPIHRRLWVLKAHDGKFWVR